MHLLVLGGTPAHQGGVEAFCARASDALSSRDGWRVSYLPTHTAYLRLRRIPVLLGGLGALWRSRAQRPDCIWLQYVTLPDLIYLALARLLGYKVMVTPHLGLNWRSQAIPVFRALSSALLRLSNRIALLSSTQATELSLPRKVPTSYVHTFLPLKILSARLPDRDRSTASLQLMHSARLSEGKGTFRFVEVCSRLKRLGVPFMARISGAADDLTYGQLQERIRRDGLEQVVKLIGHATEEQQRDLLLQADVLVHLSTIDSYPLIVLEALACGVLPICIGLAGARSMIEEFDGFCVDQDSAVEEAVRILTGIDLSSTRRKAPQTAASVRSAYSWVKCTDELEQALDDL